MKNKSSTDVPEYSEEAEIEIMKPSKALELSKKILGDETEENSKLKMQKINVKFDSSVGDRKEEE